MLFLKHFLKKSLKEVIEDGHKVFGENKVQEALEKWKSLKNEYKNLELHLIGPLQSNKTKQALEIFDVIQTIDREKIVIKIKDLVNSEFKNRNYKFFVQVNIGNEKQKSGVQISDLRNFLKWIKNDIKLNIDRLNVYSTI